jgi:hypothetical protein
MEKVRIPRGWALPWAYPTGLFIRDYLKKKGVAHVYEIWDELRKARLAGGVVDKEGKPRVCTYDNFMRNYIYVLKRLGLIELVGKSPSLKAGRKLPRHLYRIVPGKENAKEWAAPQRFFDPRRGLGSKRYRKRKKK